MDQFRKKQQLTKPAPAMAAPTVQSVAHKSSAKKYIIIVAIIFLLLTIFGATCLFFYKNKSVDLVGVNKNQYQALFLTNGQVYFGKLEKADSNTIKISDIYYLQVQQAVQPKDDEKQQNETQLVKLGEELHGPEDQMFIDRDQVIFWENLKDNGKVVEAIKSYKK